MAKVQVEGGTELILTPSNNTLISTDKSVDIVTVGIQGPAGIKGDTGDTGPAGGGGSAEWLLGSGIPSNGLGVDTNYYTDSDTEEIYRKTGGSWVLTGDFNTADGGFF